MFHIIDMPEPESFWNIFYPFCTIVSCGHCHRYIQENTIDVGSLLLHVFILRMHLHVTLSRKCLKDDRTLFS